MSTVVTVSEQGVKITGAEGPLSRAEVIALNRQLQTALGEYTPPPIAGYRTLPQETVDAMNDIKALGNEHIGPMIERFREREGANGGRGGGFRWISIANTHFQQGLMALLRAVAKPEGY